MVEFVRKKPLGIAACMVMLGFIGFVGTLASTGILLSLFGDGPFLINGESATRAEFVAMVGPMMTLYLPGCLLAATIAWSIHKEHPRSRPLLLVYSFMVLPMVPLFIYMGVPAAETASMLVPGLLVPVAAWFYLYRKDAVVQYYAAIQMDRETFPEPT
jgi:hypothetical protein